jgi:hypothetical protein
MSDDFEIGDASRRAADVVSQERDSHGDAYTNHRQIAALWSAFLDDQLDADITPWQAAIMMQQVKQSRMQAGELIADHFVTSLATVTSDYTLLFAIPIRR